MTWIFFLQILSLSLTHKKLFGRSRLHRFICHTKKIYFCALVKRTWGYGIITDSRIMEFEINSRGRVEPFQWVLLASYTSNCWYRCSHRGIRAHCIFLLRHMFHLCKNLQTCVISYFVSYCKFLGTVYFWGRLQMFMTPSHVVLWYIGIRFTIRSRDINPVQYERNGRFWHFERVFVQVNFGDQQQLVWHDLNHNRHRGIHTAFLIFFNEQEVIHNNMIMVCQKDKKKSNHNDPSRHFPNNCYSCVIYKTCSTLKYDLSVCPFHVKW